MLRTMPAFYYFGFGSNLLSARIKVQNKSAERVGPGKLIDYRLDFANAAANKELYSPNWNGCPATIIECPGSVVHGAVWRINDEDIDELDRQEGVECGIYKPISVKVLVEIEGELAKVACRTYKLVHNPSTPLDPAKRPFERQPSQTYLTVILNGAEETGLPADYIEFLKSFKHNGNAATNKDLVAQLNLKEIL